MEITIMKNILDRNQNRADAVRTLLLSKKLVMANMISAPGSGKTTLLGRTCAALGGRYRIGVIEGDITTDRDAQRLKKYGIPIVVINTEGGCHLDSHSISKVLGKFDLDNLDILFVENVGNLICPSQFDLGETCKVALLSVTEGDDKPAKYPMLFREAGVVLLNKTDLLPYTDFSNDTFISDLNMLNPKVPLLKISCTTGEGLGDWYEWIARQIEEMRDNH
jgi:hydrogenase nickel incorporation protein HypB